MKSILLYVSLALIATTSSCSQKNLLESIREREIEKVKRTINIENINRPDSNANSPVMVAIQTLKKAQKDLSTTNTYSPSAQLQQNSVFISSKITLLLLDREAPTQTKNKELKTAFHLICQEPPTQYDEAIVQSLIKVSPAPSDAVNALDLYMISPFMYALINNSPAEVIERLYYAGARITNEQIKFLKKKDKLRRPQSIINNDACKTFYQLAKQKAEKDEKKLPNYLSRIVSNDD